MTTMIEIVQLIAGVPTTEFQENILFLFATVLSLLMIMYFLYIFKLIGGFIRPR